MCVSGALLELPRIAAAFDRGESLDGAALAAKDALVYLCQRILETGDRASITAGREACERSSFAVVVHRCPDCAAGTVETDAGRVEIEPEARERIERSAELVVLEPPLPARGRGQRTVPSH